MATLISKDGAHEQYLVTPTVVGRSPVCALFIPRSFVSAHHAEIRWEHDAWSVRDLGSRNGTYVDQKKLRHNQPVRLSSGSVVAFGDLRESWSLRDCSRPAVHVEDTTTGVRTFAEDGLLMLCSPSAESLSIFYRRDGWQLEGGDSTLGLADGQTFLFDRRLYRFHLANAASQTVTLDEPARLCKSTLRIRVTRDEEDVSAILETRDRLIDLGTRHGFYLLLVLARKRLGDADNSGRDPGWMAVTDLLRMLPDYGSVEHLNVDVYRLRKHLARQGVLDAPSIIERFDGHVRLGCSNVVVEQQNVDESS
ncbi:MAG TPA: FHA domain-containing protein [Polyangiaceae bacterium]|nr:FHA domain-containing protein [Polyangiaceae bacterium]